MTPNSLQHPAFFPNSLQHPAFFPNPHNTLLFFVQNEISISSLPSFLSLSVFLLQIFVAFVFLLDLESLVHVNAPSGEVNYKIYCYYCYFSYYYMCV